MAEWREVSLGDVLTRITYGFTNPMPTTLAGPVMVTAKDIRHGRIDYASARHTSQEAFDDLLTDKSRPRVGDVLLTKDGSIGRIAVCDQPSICINQSVALLQPLPTAIDSFFLAYLLQAPRYQRLMDADSGGSTIKHIYITRVDKMRIAIPPLERQVAIAQVLRALDDKIAANRRVVDRCRELARALWEPVAREARPLSDLARFVNGRAFTKGASGTGRVVVRIAELNSGLGASTIRSDIEVADDHVARPGDLLFAWSGSLTVARWYRSEAIINQHIFKVIPNDGVPMWLVDQAVRAKLEDYRAIAADKATTMGHIQRAHLDQPVLIPPRAEVERLDGVMQSLWDRALAAEVEIVQLEETRDELLPLLMSGKVRVRCLPDDLNEVAAG